MVNVKKLKIIKKKTKKKKKKNYFISSLKLHYRYDSYD